MGTTRSLLLQYFSNVLPGELYNKSFDGTFAVQSLLSPLHPVQAANFCFTDEPMNLSGAAHQLAVGSSSS
eukprot:s467_g23.t1